MSLLEKIQTVLDTLLNTDKVYVYWQRKTESKGQDPKEYVIYSQNDSPPGINADNKPLTRDAGITVRYYYLTDLQETRTGRAKVQTRAKSILVAMENARFESTTGIMWMGDIDSVGKSVAVMDFTYSEVE